jgi:hypothetical protein
MEKPQTSAEKTDISKTPIKCIKLFRHSCKNCQKYDYKKNETKCCLKNIKALELIRAMRNKSLLEGYDFEVVSKDEDFNIVSEKKMTAEELKLNPNKPNKRLEVNVAEIDIDAETREYKLIGKSVCYYISIIYKDGDVKWIIPFRTNLV